MKHLSAIFLLLVFSGTLAFSTQPNILLIIADDCTYRDLGVYGGRDTEMKAHERMPRKRSDEHAPNTD